MDSHALTRKPPVGELQQDGHLTVTELAGRVDVSLSPCHRRLRASDSPVGGEPVRVVQLVGGSLRQRLLRDWP
jgi:hypothetical protein